MDCCNYVEAYAGGGHFYQQQQQQQHYFCYDNGNPGYGGYEVPPINGAIEAAARYNNGAPPPAYPTDYVYNPKEARLRKAMREQSRELSRRSILQSAIARAGAIAGPPGAAGGFVDHQHRFGCVSAAALPMSPPVDSERLSESWFQSAHRPKPIHSPRMSDWYGNVGDPIERLRAMGAMHRGMENKCKDAMRNQLTAAADCGAGFANSGYSTDFGPVSRERELRRQDNIAEYAEFAEGQKWHPYQNGASPHQHPRTPHPSQMSGILHPNVQNPNSHGHGHGPWGQFCHGALPHIPAMARNVGLRGPRHAVFLRDRMPNRHCGFSEENPRLTYAPSKLDVENVRASYPQPEHQIPRLMESPVDSVIDAASTARNRRENDEGTRWEPNAINRGMTVDGSVPTPTQQEPRLSREKEREMRRTAEKIEPRKKVVSRQPLPGFHQAFGSTEIGRFSRSEYFVNMVGESSGNAAEETENSDVSTDRMSETNGNAAGDATTVVGAVVTPAVTTTIAGGTNFDADESEEGTFDDSSNELVGNNASIGSYRGQRPVIPRWHSPHVATIGSEI